MKEGASAQPGHGTLLAPRLAEDARHAQVVWARVRGYPSWPAQVLSDVAARKKLGKVPHKRDLDVPVMFFGTLEIAWIGKADIVPFAEGLQKGFLGKGKQKNFQKALEQVGEFLSADKKRKAPTHWWCKAPTLNGQEDTGKQPSRSSSAAKLGGKKGAAGAQGDGGEEEEEEEEEEEGSGDGSSGDEASSSSSSSSDDEEEEGDDGGGGDAEESDCHAQEAEKAGKAEKVQGESQEKKGKRKAVAAGQEAAVPKAAAKPVAVAPASKGANGAGAGKGAKGGDKEAKGKGKESKEQAPAKAEASAAAAASAPAAAAAAAPSGSGRGAAPTGYAPERLTRSAGPSATAAADADMRGKAAASPKEKAAAGKAAVNSNKPADSEDSRLPKGAPAASSSKPDKDKGGKGGKDKQPQERAAKKSETGPSKLGGSKAGGAKPVASRADSAGQAAAAGAVAAGPASSKSAAEGPSKPEAAAPAVSGLKRTASASIGAAAPATSTASAPAAHETAQPPRRRFKVEDGGAAGGAPAGQSPSGRGAAAASDAVAGRLPPAAAAAAAAAVVPVVPGKVDLSSLDEQEILKLPIEIRRLAGIKMAKKPSSAVSPREQGGKEAAATTSAASVSALAAAAAATAAVASAATSPSDGGAEGAACPPPAPVPAKGKGEHQRRRQQHRLQQQAAEPEDDRVGSSSALAALSEVKDETPVAAAGAAAAATVTAVTAAHVGDKNEDEGVPEDVEMLEAVSGQAEVAGAAGRKEGEEGCEQAAEGGRPSAGEEEEQEAGASADAQAEAAAKSLPDGKAKHAGLQRLQLSDDAAPSRAQVSPSPGEARAPRDRREPTSHPGRVTPVGPTPSPGAGGSAVPSPAITPLGSARARGRLDRQTVAAEAAAAAARREQQQQQQQSANTSAAAAAAQEQPAAVSSVVAVAAVAVSAVAAVEPVVVAEAAAVAESKAEEQRSECKGKDAEAAAVGTAAAAPAEPSGAAAPEAPAAVRVRPQSKESARAELLERKRVRERERREAERKRLRRAAEIAAGAGAEGGPDSPSAAGLGRLDPLGAAAALMRHRDKENDTAEDGEAGGSGCGLDGAGGESGTAGPAGVVGGSGGSPHVGGRLGLYKQRSRGIAHLDAGGGSAAGSAWVTDRCVTPVRMVAVEPSPSRLPVCSFAELPAGLPLLLQAASSLPLKLQQQHSSGPRVGRHSASAGAMLGSPGRGRDFMALDGGRGLGSPLGSLADVGPFGKDGSGGRLACSRSMEEQLDAEAAEALQLMGMCHSQPLRLERGSHRGGGTGERDRGERDRGERGGGGASTAGFGPFGGFAGLGDFVDAVTAATASGAEDGGGQQPGGKFVWPEGEPLLPDQQEVFMPPGEWLMVRPPQYEHIKRNVWVSRKRPTRLHKEEISVCYCQAPDIEFDEDGRPIANGGCVEGCLNRQSFIHCDVRSCPCGELCSNKPFHLLRPPRVQVFLTENRGHGVRAMQYIAKGSYIVEYCGEVVDAKELEARMFEARREGEQHFYIMDLGAGLFIDARHKGNVARLLNSCCDPNCETQKWHDAATGEARVGVFARKDIRPGEELTYDYFFEHYGSIPPPAASFQCMCGARNCRGTMDANPEKRKDLGRRVEVYWDGDGIFYRATIIGYNATTRKHVVLYDDGDKERVCLEEVAHRWLDDEGLAMGVNLDLGLGLPLGQQLGAVGRVPGGFGDECILPGMQDLPASGSAADEDAMACDGGPPSRSGATQQQQQQQQQQRGEIGLPLKKRGRAGIMGYGGSGGVGAARGGRGGGGGISAGAAGANMDSLLQAVQALHGQDTSEEPDDPSRPSSTDPMQQPQHQQLQHQHAERGGEAHHHHHRSHQQQHAYRGGRHGRHHHHHHQHTNGGEHVGHQQSQQQQQPQRGFFAGSGASPREPSSHHHHHHQQNHSHNHVASSNGYIAEPTSPTAARRSSQQQQQQPAPWNQDSGGGAAPGAGSPAGCTAAPSYRLEDLLGIRLAPCSVPLFRTARSPVAGRSSGGAASGARAAGGQQQGYGLDGGPHPPADPRRLQGAGSGGSGRPGRKGEASSSGGVGRPNGVVTAGPSGHQQQPNWGAGGGHSGGGGGGGDLLQQHSQQQHSLHHALAKSLSVPSSSSGTMGLVLNSSVLAAMPAAQMSTVSLFQAVKYG